jgi:YegS/Rv2252/BmrU family lipid kinase
VQLIVNPAARGGRTAEGEAAAAFAAAGVAVTLHRTAGPGDAARVAAALLPQLAPAGDEALFVLGGDGTVMEAVGALVGSGAAVGILPGGTGNQLARHLGIPLGVAAAVRALATPRVVPFDLGRLADGRWFALTAGFGLDAAIIAGASKASKRRFGVGAYFLSALRALRAAPRFAVRVETDGAVVEREASLAMIANVGSVMDGRIAFGPDAAPDDGWLDVCILSPRGAVDALALAARLHRRDFRPDPRMLLLRARSARLTTDAAVSAQADGELLTVHDLAAMVAPAAARFLAPGR